MELNFKHSKNGCFLLERNECMRYLIFIYHRICSKIHRKRMVKKMGVYSTVKDTIKDAVTIAQKSDNIQLYKSILDAYNAAIELMGENVDLKERIKELESQKVTGDMLEFNNNAYWVKKEDGSVDGPFCSKCWDSEKKLVRMHVVNIKEKAKAAKCPNCNSMVRNCEYNGSWTAPY